MFFSQRPFLTIHRLDDYYQYILANPPIAESRYLHKEELLECQQEAINFIEDTAERIMSFSPKIVAIGNMFQQNNALFALLKALRRRSSELVILVGGCNCYDTAGRALIKYFPEIDYIFQGEADEIMADFCQVSFGGERLMAGSCLWHYCINTVILTCLCIA